MAQPQHGGARAPDRKPRPPAGPGKLANRQDMSKVTPAGKPAQGVYTPGMADSPDLQYGDKSRLASAQTSVPLPSESIPPAPAAAAATPSPPRGAPPAAAPGQGLTPQDLLAMVSGHPTDYPQQPLATPAAPPSQSLAFKIDALRYLSTLPFAGPEIQSLMKNAQVEYDQAQRARFMPPVASQGVLALPEPALAAPAAPAAPEASQGPVA